MGLKYKKLRNTIYCNEETVWFWQLVVNVAMAIDIVDAELKKLRNKRWDKAFADNLKDNNSHHHHNHRNSIRRFSLSERGDSKHFNAIGYSTNPGCNQYENSNSNVNTATRDEAEEDVDRKATIVI